MGKLLLKELGSEVTSALLSEVGLSMDDTVRSDHVDGILYQAQWDMAKRIIASFGIQIRSPVAPNAAGTAFEVVDWEELDRGIQAPMARCMICMGRAHSETGSLPVECGSCRFYVHLECSASDSVAGLRPPGKDICGKCNELQRAELVFHRWYGQDGEVPGAERSHINDSRDTWDQADSVAVGVMITCAQELFMRP